MNELDNILGNYEPPSPLEKVAGAFRRIGHGASMIPFINAIPFFSMAIGTTMTAIATAVDTVDGFANKSFGKGTKNFISGVADTAVTSLATFWIPIPNWISSLASGDTLGELARKGTAGVLDSIAPNKPTPTELAREMKVLGRSPMTMGAVPAGIGMAAAMQPQMVQTATINPATNQPMPANYWADKEAQNRGQSPQEARANYIRNNHEDVVALSQAAAQDTRLGA